MAAREGGALFSGGLFRASPPPAVEEADTLPLKATPIYSALPSWSFNGGPLSAVGPFLQNNQPAELLELPPHFLTEEGHRRRPAPAPLNRRRGSPRNPVKRQRQRPAGRTRRPAGFSAASAPSPHLTSPQEMAG